MSTDVLLDELEDGWMNLRMSHGWNQRPRWFQHDSRRHPPGKFNGAPFPAPCWILAIWLQGTSPSF